MADAPQLAINEEGRVHMLDIAGAPVTVDRADVDQAIAAGYGLEQAGNVEARRLARERGTLGQQAITVGEGALEGATLGLGTAAAVNLLGDDYRQAALERQQVNPYSHLAGQVIGNVAPVAFSGGSSLAARGIAAAGAPARGVAALGGLAERGAARLLGGVAERGVLGRAAARGLELGASGAVEGAAMGLGSSISDAALQDTEWTADKALAAMADGAWYGLTTGGAVGAGSSVLGSAGKAALAKMTGGKSFKEAVQDFAETRATKQVIGHNAKLYNDITNSGANPERLNRIGRKLLDRDIPLTGNIDDATRAVQAQTDDAIQRLKGVAQRVDDAGVKVNSRDVIGRIDEQIEKLKAVDLNSYKQVARKLEKEVLPFRKRVEAGKVLRKGDDGVVRAEQNFKDMSFSEMWDLRKKLDDTVNWSKREGNPATDALKQLRKELDDSLTRTLEGKADTAADLLSKNAETPGGAKAVGNLRDEWKAAKEDYADFRSVADGLEDEFVRREKNRFTSASDLGVAATGANILGTLAGISTGSIGVGALTSMATGAAGSLAHKFVRERGSGILAKMADSIAKSELRNTAAARVLAGIQPAKTVVRAETRRKDSKRRSEEFKSAIDHVQRFSADPAYVDAHLRHTFGEIASEQPEVAQRMMAGMQADMAYLASKAPAPLTNGAKSWTPLKEKPTYTREQQKEFLAVVEALADPSSVAEDMAHGELNLDAVEALKVRRPREYADLREKVMVACEAREDELPYNRVNYLSLAFDFAGDESHEPATIAAIQASVAPPAHPGPTSSKLNPAIPESTVLPNEAALGA